MHFIVVHWISKLFQTMQVPLGFIHMLSIQIETKSLELVIYN